MHIEIINKDYSSKVVVSKQIRKKKKQLHEKENEGHHSSLKYGRK